MIYARRYDWRTAHPYDNTVLLDGFVARPEFLAYPCPPEEARAVGAGLVADPMNPAQIARIIQQLLDDPVAAEAMGRCARESVMSRYLWSSEEKKLFALYEELLA